MDGSIKMINDILCSHTNSTVFTVLVQCVMGQGSPYKPFIIVVGIISFCAFCWAVGLDIADKRKDFKEYEERLEKRGKKK